jgi:ABC-type antimicrobial peptide transport system permease subunit
MLIASQTATLIYLLVGAVCMALSALYMAWRASRRDRRRRKKQD